MATKIPDNYAYSSQKPNFERDTLKTLEELRNDRNTVKYDVGHIVFCKETQEHYKFMGSSVDFDESTGYFRNLINIPDSFVSRVEMMWNELFPATVELNLYNANTGLLLTGSYPSNKPINVEVRFSIKENGIELDKNRISSIRLNYGIQSINIPIGTTKYTIFNISNTTTFSVVYTLIDGSTKTSSKTISFYVPEIKANIKLYKAGTNLSIMGSYEYGVPVKVEARISITEDNIALDESRIKSIELTYDDNLINIPVGTTKYTIEDGIINTTTFTITYTLVDGITYSASQKMSFIYSSYHGVVDKDTIASNIDITILNKKLLSSKGFTTTFKLINQKYCYLYPSSYGELTSIKDDKNYELLESFLKDTITINDISYYAYVLEYAVTVEDDYKLTFS